MGSRALGSMGVSGCLPFLFIKIQVMCHRTQKASVTQIWDTRPFFNVLLTARLSEDRRCAILTIHGRRLAGQGGALATASPCYGGLLHGRPVASWGCCGVT